jgi:biopolymer transport protein ExbD
MMNLRKKSEQSAEVFTSAMNDIMFFLMLFFIIISTLLNPSMINVSLPKAQNTPQAVHTKEIKLTITKDLLYYVNNNQVSMDDLESQLKTEIAGSKDVIVVLRIDNSLSIQEMVNVLSIGSKLGVKMTIATAKPGK